MMIYSRETGETVYEANGATGVRLYEAAGNEYVHITIEPGGGIPEHALPLAVSFCVLKGSGTCTISGQPLALSSGQMAECPPEELRSWENAGSEDLELLVIKRSL
jgi:quercetin dioxygenase-like cupin family protein